MTNETIDALCQTLSDSFGKGYTIYTEDVKQGLNTPCFFVICVIPQTERYRGNRYFHTGRYCITYIPAGAEPSRECNDIADRLFDCLEYIDLLDARLPGTKMEANLADGQLHFLVNYNSFIVREQKTEPMEELSFQFSTKGEADGEK